MGFLNYETIAIMVLISLGLIFNIAKAGTPKRREETYPTGITLVVIVLIEAWILSVLWRLHGLIP